MDAGIVARPGPLRAGRRAYEGFYFDRRNRIYANFRKSLVRLQFGLPQEGTYPGTEIVQGSGRTWRALNLRTEQDLRLALRLASDTVAWARGSS